MSAAPNLNDDLKSAALWVNTDAENVTGDTELTSRSKPLQAFPIDVFPPIIQEIINATYTGLQFPKDFSGASILFALSVATRNNAELRVKEGWHESSLLYITLVGPPGSNKTHPLKFFIEPIFEMDLKSFTQFKRLNAEYMKNGQKSKQEPDQLGVDTLVKPRWQKILISDTTPEALADTHDFNRGGLGSYNDELATWFKNFDRYHKGSDEQFWLSNWSSAPIIIDRKGGDPIFIKKPFISVAGTIQPGVIKDLAKNRTANGFLDRILFVTPDNLQKEYWGEEHLDSSVRLAWRDILNRILSVNRPMDDDNQISPEVIHFSSRGFKVLSEWQRHNTDLCNAQHESLKGVYTKLENYVIRFTLILHILKRACGQDEGHIEPSTVHGAIKLVEYFRATATRVHTLLSSSPLDRIPGDKRKLYEALPQEFTTKEGIAIAESIGVPTRNCERFLGQDEFFVSVKRGHYEKRIK